MDGEDLKSKELAIISELLRYDEFARFYHDEWEHRNISIEIKIDPSCKNFAMYSKENNKPFIVIQELPKTFDNAFLVAHEMCHAIRDFDGVVIIFGARQPSNYKEEELFDMSSKLGSMLDDPLIDSFLKDEYGFNPARFYVNVLIPTSVKSLCAGGDPLHDWHVFKNALLYAQYALQWDAITDSSEWDKLKEQYKIRRPKVTAIGEELYAMSKENSYDNPEKQRILFNKIFNKYIICRDILHCDKLSDILCVV
jgi:hypothetical protein